MTFVTRRAIVAGAAALSLAVAGCGRASDSKATPAPTSSSHNAILAAYGQTLHAKTARITLHETVSLTGEQQVVINRSGVVTPSASRRTSPAKMVTSPFSHRSWAR
jgi:hypothetical protein